MFPIGANQIISIETVGTMPCSKSDQGARSDFVERRRSSVGVKKEDETSTSGLRRETFDL